MALDRLFDLILLSRDGQASHVPWMNNALHWEEFGRISSTDWSTSNWLLSKLFWPAILESWSIESIGAVTWSGSEQICEGWSCKGGFWWEEVKGSEETSLLGLVLLDWGVSLCLLEARVYAPVTAFLYGLKSEWGVERGVGDGIEEDGWVEGVELSDLVGEGRTRELIWVASLLLQALSASD